MRVAPLCLGRTAARLEQYRGLPGCDDQPDPIGQHAPTSDDLEYGVVAPGVLLMGHYRQTGVVAEYGIARGARHLPPGVREAPLCLF